MHSAGKYECLFESEGRVGQCFISAVFYYGIWQFLRDPYAGRVNVSLTDPEADMTFYVKDRRSFKTDKNMEVWNETEECVNCCERY